MRKLSADGTSKAASDYMVINDVALEGGILYLNFASGYTGLSDKDKALFRTAVSKTMSSLDFVEYVRIYENGSPVTDSNGVDIGLLNNQSFITDSNSDDEIDTTEAVLYYSDSVGSSLVGEKKTITYDKNTPVEKVILKHIIDGPSGNGNKRTVPSNLRILSVYTKKEPAMLILIHLFEFSCGCVSGCDDIFHSRYPVRIKRNSKGSDYG